MSVPFRGTSGPSGLRPALGQPAVSGSQTASEPALASLQRIPPEQSIPSQLRRLTQSVLSQNEESAVTKEQIDTLLKSLDKAGVGTNGGGTANKLQSMQGDALLVSMERIKDILQVISDRVENPGYLGSGDGKDVSELLGDIRAVVNDCQSLIPASTIPGESPPPAPRACFGRDDLIEEIVGYTENLTPMALIGAGGIGKTSIALTVLHHHRIKQRFGENRRFIRCDQFSSSSAHLLNRLSKVIGAGIENPEDLTSLYPSLSSTEMLIVLDNAESILDPRGTDAKKIYALVEELGRLETICLFITSRISTVPSECEIFDIPTLSINAARDTFYRIYKKKEQSNLVTDILEQLESHPLSITLFATVAHQNRWDTERLTREWKTRRTNALQTEHNESLAATIELSLASPLFQGLGPDARALIEVVAFFPQGVNENNVDWLFPTISNGTNILDKFCILSLTYRSNGFITTLAPLRDYLSPKDPRSSTLLCTTKERYFARMSVPVDPDRPDFGESRWITSEDVNVEHLLDTFTMIDTNSAGVWEACADFMRHLYWHKKRLTILKPKIEGLPDDHPSKLICLRRLSWLSDSVGNRVECKRFIILTLMLGRGRGDNYCIADALSHLSYTNKGTGLYGEGIQQAREALGVYESLDDTEGLVNCLSNLAWLLKEDKQFDVAEEAASRAIDLLSEKGDQYQSLVCQSHRVLGAVYKSKGEIEKAIHHFETSLRIASPFHWYYQLFWTHYSLVELFRDEHKFNDANAHIERARSHTDNDAYRLGCAMVLQASVWYRQDRLEEARTEALHAADIFEKIGAVKRLEGYRELFHLIQGKLNDPVSGPSGFNSQGTER